MTSKVKVNTVETESGSTLTLGKSGDTVTLASGASQSGFGRTGTVNWDTTAKTASFTAVSGNGYFVNTTSASITVTLPASPSGGDIVAVKDYAGTSATNNIVIGRNSSPIRGGTLDYRIDTNGNSVTFVYIDGTRGWEIVNDGLASSAGPDSDYVIATGGTITCCGDYKIHTFTSPGTFTVSAAGTPSGSNTVDYLIVGGGGGGGKTGNADRAAGGAGAGGYRFSDGTASGCYTAGPSPLGASALPVSVQGYPITVGGGGPGGTGSTYNGTQGSNSIFSTITSTGGGYGAGAPGATAGGSGGNGGGGRNGGTGGTGNSPPVSPIQGNDGGTGGGGGGGGGGIAGAGGSKGPTGCAGGCGGAGLTSCITASPVARGGGGSGGANAANGPSSGGTGGGGAGGSGSGNTAGSAGTANTGGGGGGGSSPSPIPVSCAGPDGGNGGSGVVIIRYKYQN